MSNITLEEIGARIYVAGNSYPIKDCIKRAGAHWDGDRKQWWIGKAKRGEIEACIAKHAPPPDGERAKETVGEDTKVKGKVEYKGRKYYLLASAGDGSSHKVCTLDGQMVFWAKAESGAKIIKTYGHERGFRGYSSYSRAHQHDVEYPTLGSIRRYIEGVKKSGGEFRGRQSSDDVRCRHCGEWTMSGDDWCLRCGKANYEA